MRFTSLPDPGSRDIFYYISTIIAVARLVISLYDALKSYRNRRPR